MKHFPSIRETWRKPGKLVDILYHLEEIISKMKKTVKLGNQGQYKL